MVLVDVPEPRFNEMDVVRIPGGKNHYLHQLFISLNVKQVVDTNSQNLIQMGRRFQTHTSYTSTDTSCVRVPEGSTAKDTYLCFRTEERGGFVL